MIHGGREQHGLAFTVIGLTVNHIQRLGKAQVEHAVGFIENQHFKAINKEAFIF